MFETLHDWMMVVGGSTVLYILPFLAVIGVLVFVHEWGHYIVARLCGVKVETFSIGFGKRIWSRRDKSGTEWQVALIPLGGYVKMFGDTDPASSSYTESVKEGDALRAMTPAEREQAFFSKPVGKRAAIVFAGPAINFLFAIVVLFGLFTTVGQPVTPALSGAIIVDSAAYEAGFRPHDRIISIDGEAVTRFSDVQRAVAVTLDKPLDVVIERDGKQMALNGVKPRLDTVVDRFGFEHSRGMLGIIGPGLAVDLTSIESVDGRSGDIRKLLLRRMDRSATIVMKGFGDKPSEKLQIKVSRELNPDLIAGQGEGSAVLQLAPRLESVAVKLSPVAAVKEAVQETWFVSVATLQTLGQMIMGTRSAQELGGIIRIGAVTGDAAQQGMLALLMLGAMLSINLGLINLLPIPMLDGGHLLFYAIEAVKGKPVPEKLQDAALRFGFVFLIALMVFANLNDLLQLAK